jgi:hypothetical protein
MHGAPPPVRLKVQGTIQINNDFVLQCFHKDVWAGWLDHLVNVW